MDTKKYILGLGNPIIDISANADEETLKKFELQMGTTVFCNEKNCGFYEYLESKPEVTYIPGGSVTNSIRVTNWLLQNSEKFGCMLLGCIGKDSYGNKISENLAAVDVNPLLEIREDRESSRCGVGIFLKERVLVPEIRASTMLSMDWVNKNMTEISKSEILLVEGYFVIEKFDIVQYLVDTFNKEKKKVAFTLSATFMVDNFYDKMLEISNKSDLIFCNEEEAYSFAKIRSENMEEVATAIHKILAPRDRILVITCGSLPVVVSKFDYEKNQISTLNKTEVPELTGEQIVDTNGCGDSFVGGFLSQFIQGFELAKCSQAGVFASSVIIKNVGCTWDKNVRIEI